MYNNLQPHTNTNTNQSCISSSVLHHHWSMFCIQTFLLPSHLVLFSSAWFLYCEACIVFRILFYFILCLLGFSCHLMYLFFKRFMWCLQWTKEDGVRQAAVANQFIPMNTNPKDVLEMRNKVSHFCPLKTVKSFGCAACYLFFYDLNCSCF